MIHLIVGLVALVLGAYRPSYDIGRRIRGVEDDVRGLRPKTTPE